MVMPEREYYSTRYRYGFNSQEHDRELNPNITTATFWEYDARLGRRWNVDPVASQWQSNYVTLNNNPILFIDPDGLYATKKKAQKMYEKAQKGGLDPGPIYKSGKEWGFNTVEGNAVVANFKRSNFPKSESVSGMFSGSPMTIYNGILREYYINQASKLRAYYDNANPLNPSNQYGLEERMKLKTWVRNNSIAGANVTLDVLEGPVEPKPLLNPKNGNVTRFYYTNPTYNTLSRIGTAASVYGVVVSAQRIANSQNPVEETARVGAGWAGAWGAMSLGAPVAGNIGLYAAACTAGNPAVGAAAAFGVELIFGVAGGIGGEAGMNWAIEKLKH